MDFLELAKNRYSCRKFSDRKVEDEKIEKIIKAGICAPTAVNYQPFKIWRVESEEARVNIHSVTTCTFGANTFLIVGCDRTAAWTREYDNYNFADVDGAIVATHMMLEIQALGLGTTWVGHFDAAKLKEIYPEMKNYDLIAIFPIGYSDESDGGKPSPRHSIRKSEAELVKNI